MIVSQKTITPTVTLVSASYHKLVVTLYVLHLIFHQKTNKVKKMSFSILSIEIKVKIFKLLDIGSRYNACLVWKEMTDETWRSIPYNRALTRRLKKGVTNLGDLEIAGVLAHAGRLDSLNKARDKKQLTDTTQS